MRLRLFQRRPRRRRPTEQQIKPGSPNEQQLKLLLETPRGFAVYTMWNPACLDQDDAVEHLWTNFVSGHDAESLFDRDDYQRVDDKSPLVIGKRLGDMLNICCSHTHLLAVGTPQYASMIQSQLGIRCVHNDVVMELMWGLKYLIEHYGPEEKLADLVGEHSLHMSKGLDILLRRHGFHHVQPHMVTEDVVNLANTLYKSDKLDERFSRYARYPASLVMEISGIDCRGWDRLKSATAFKVIWFPRERENLLAQSHTMFTHEEISRLQAAQPAQYEGTLNESDILSLYQNALDVSEHQTRVHKALEVSLGMSNVKPPGHK